MNEQEQLQCFLESQAENGLKFFHIDVNESNKQFILGKYREYLQECASRFLGELVLKRADHIEDYSEHVYFLAYKLGSIRLESEQVADKLASYIDEFNGNWVHIAMNDQYCNEQVALMRVIAGSMVKSLEEYFIL